MTVAGYTLTPEQVELKKFAREVAQRHLVARADEVEKAGAFFPRDLIDLFRDLSLLGIDVPQEHGGQGLDVLTCALVMEEIARGWFSASSYPVAMGTGPILAAGTPEQKARYLSKIARGEVITAFALTEPDAGSDASGLRTVARRDGDAYVINGRKIFITNAHIADVLLTFATVDPHGERGKGVTLFLVDKGTPGLQIGHRFRTLAHEANPIWEVLYDDCRVPVDNRLGQEGEGFSYMQVGFAKTRALYAARCLGLAQAALDYAARYAEERVQFGQPIARFQGMRFKIADMATRVEAARHLVYRAASLVDERAPQAPAVASMAKLFASDTTVYVATEAVQILGGHGYTRDHPVERYFREAKLCQIGEGTNEVLRLLISRHVRDGLR